MSESVFSARTVGRAALISKLTSLSMDTEKITHDLAKELYDRSRELAPYRSGELKDSHDVVRAKGGGWALKVRANHTAPVIAGHNQPRGYYNFIAEAMDDVLGNRSNLDRMMKAAIAARGLGR